MPPRSDDSRGSTSRRDKQVIDALERSEISPVETRYAELVDTPGITFPVYELDPTARPDVASWIRALLRSGQVDGRRISASWRFLATTPLVAMLFYEVRRPALLKFHLAFIALEEREELASIAAAGRIGLTIPPGDPAHSIFLDVPTEELRAYVAGLAALTAEGADLASLIQATQPEQGSRSTLRNRPLSASSIDET